MSQVTPIVDNSIGKAGSGFDSRLSLSLSLKNDLHTLLKSNEKLVHGLLEGFSLDINGSVNSDFMQALRKEIIKPASEALEKEGSKVSKKINSLFWLALLKDAKADVTLTQFEKEELVKILTKIGSKPALEATPTLN